MNNKPNYIKMLEDGSLLKRVERLKKHLRDCFLCPHECGVDRRKRVGICRARDKAIVSSYGPHMGEESVLVGRRGSGTIFFGYCNLNCVFCQNYQLSHQGEGRSISSEKLAEIMLLIQNRYACHNINLVTPTHFIPNIVEAIYLAAKEGLRLPIVYNCGGYESVKTLRLLDGIIDIYMPDFKYISHKSGRLYSKVEDYPERAKSALIEMNRQVGGIKIDKRGLVYKGLMIRHLVMPDGFSETKGVLDFIKKNLSEDVLVNIMGQYYPAYRAFDYPEIARRLDKDEFQKAYEYGKSLGLSLC